MNTAQRPRIGLLALTLDLYETLAPALRASREAWVRERSASQAKAAGRAAFQNGGLPARRTRGPGGGI